ncbi:MAG TPA: enoyl-CoA hydratase/isomerase family protein [Candidatus Lustribacter sp.]|jgi:enoyl-CoA hydratase|nr:enoyl-CoA hydratase/isomerase family protein [Candidatus Lustribacter sp.]
MIATEGLIVTQIGRGLQITLNDPAGVSDIAALELTNTLLSAHERAAYVVLRSNSADFIIGRNNPRPPADAPIATALARRRFSEVIFNCYGSFRACTVPIIGVVQGRAMGLGVSVAALCDITFASDKATFQINEMNHRILPTMVMSSLVDRVNRKDLMYLVLSRATISAARAQEMKIVTEVVPADRLDAAVAELVAIFEETPTAAIQGVKEYIAAAYDMPIRGAVDFARNLHATINAAPEMQAKPVV